MLAFSFGLLAAATAYINRGFLPARAGGLRSVAPRCCAPPADVRSQRSLLREQRRVVRELADELCRLEVRGSQAVEYAEELFGYGVRCAADLSTVPIRVLDAVGIVGRERSRLLAFSRLAAMEAAAPAPHAASSRGGDSGDEDEDGQADGAREETFTVVEAQDGARVDAALALLLPPLSRTYFGTLATDGLVKINGGTAKKSARVSVGNVLSVRLRAERELAVAAEAVPLEAIYEDADVIVLNKQAGLVVHPAPGNWNGTIVNGLLHRMREQQAAGGALAGGAEAGGVELLPDVSGTGLRPGIVHRLDKYTTGALVAAKTARAQRALLAAFAERRVWKVYLAVCVGDPGEHAVVDEPVGRSGVDRLKMAVVQEVDGGRNALSLVHRLATDGRCSLVAVLIRTGRTHQVRPRRLGPPPLPLLTRPSLPRSECTSSTCATRCWATPPTGTRTGTGSRPRARPARCFTRALCASPTR